MRKSLTLLFVAALVTAGCVPHPLPPRKKPAPQRLPLEMIRYYDYPHLSFRARTVSRKTRSGYSLEKLELSAGGANGRPIRFDWYRPEKKKSGGRLPLVLMSPILAGNDLYVREFAAFYASKGMNTAIVYRQKEPFSPDRPLKDMEEHFRRTIIEMRQTLDWLETQPSVDPKRVGTFAISMGAILTAILPAVEPRIRCSVLGLPAGHLAEVIMTSEDKAIRKRRKAYLERRGWDERQALRELQAVIFSEPIRFAPGVDPDRTLIIAGLFDRVMGFQRSMDLWRAMGRPKLILLPTGHYTAYLATPVLKVATYSFLARHLEPE